MKMTKEEIAILDARMKEAGMTPVSEMLTRPPLGGFGLHAGVKDLDTFEQWLKMRYEEMLIGQVKYTLDGKEEDDMFEWYLAHAAVLGEMFHQFKAIRKMMQENDEII